MPGVNVTVDEQDVVGDEGGELLASIVLVGLLNLEGRLEVLSVNVLAELDPVGDGDHVSEGLSLRVSSLEVGKLSASLVGPLTHRAGGGSILGLLDHVVVGAVHARDGRPEVVGNLSIGIERRHTALDVAGETTASLGNVVLRSFVVVLNGSLPVAHQVLHEGGAIQIRVKRLANLELALHLGTAGGGGQLLLDDLSGSRDGGIASRSGEVGQRLVNNLEVFMEVEGGLNGGRRGDGGESDVRILDAEESGQGTRVAATEGDDGRVVSLVLLTNSKDELGSISEGLLGRKPLKVLSRQGTERLRVSVVTMLNTDLESLVLSSVHAHSVASDDTGRLGAFSSKLEEDGSIGGSSRPVLVLNPVTLSKSTLVLVVVVIQALLVGKSLNSQAIGLGNYKSKFQALVTMKGDIADISRSMSESSP